MKRILLALVLGIGLASAPVAPSVAAAEGTEALPSAEQLVQQVEAKYQEVQSITADFEQVTRSAAMGETRQKGTVALARPRSMRWDSTADAGALIVSDGTSIWIYNPADKQVLQFQDMSSSASGLDLLENLSALDERFGVKVEQADKKGRLLVRLSPKEESQYTEIRLKLVQADMVLEQLVLVDAFGTETEISFSKLKLDGKVDAGAFSFTPPAGVEVIKADEILMQKVHLVSLGCPKNRVDSEVMVGTLQAGEYELVDDAAEAEVIIVNTCSFIQPATEESVETVLEMARFKEAGSCQKLVVTGCMVQRFGAALEGELPEVDHFLGTGEYHRVREVLDARAGQAPRSFVDVPLYIHDELAPRVNSWAPHSAYLKISEGCNHRCTFCIIPQLRGKLRSRSVESLVTEAASLAAQGVRELNLISQDSTAYGRDLYGQPRLAELLRALARVEGIEWIRIHYAYPIGLPDDLLQTLADEPKVLPYLDMPLQHASGPMLKAMKRGVTRAGQERILSRVRQAVPDIAIRTTFIVGFPGETHDDFAVLQDFVREQRFTRVGVFTYFQEDGTPAAELPRQVPEELRAQRQTELMETQRRISREGHEALVGEILPVMVDGLSKESELLLVGRLPSQAPDVDGQVILTSAPKGTAPGQVRRCRITEAHDYDLVGELV